MEVSSSSDAGQQENSEQALFNMAPKSYQKGLRNSHRAKVTSSDDQASSRKRSTERTSNINKDEQPRQSDSRSSDTAPSKQNCLSCGKFDNFSRGCRCKLYARNNCGVRGSLKNMCRSVKRGSSNQFRQNFIDANKLVNDNESANSFELTGPPIYPE